MDRAARHVPADCQHLHPKHSPSALMRYLALATDYDGTIAQNCAVDDATLAALERLRASGRRLILVTGRELPSLFAAFPRCELFDWIVSENGAVLYQPAMKETIRLADPPPKSFVAALRGKGVAPLSAGESIVATWEPHEQTVLETIRDGGLDLQVVFNKGAVMVLPAGVTKATGLAAALERMGLSPHNVAGIGDAENDHAFLKLCELSAAVANALPAVKETADIVTIGDHGAGVAELIDQLVSDDLASLAQQLTRHDLSLGTSRGAEVRLPAHGGLTLVCGPSGSGKSTVATRIAEAVLDRGYQLCLVDPEGDYESFTELLLGGGNNPPSRDEIVHALQNPQASLVVNLVGLPVSGRPPFFLELFAALVAMRAQVGRPHWLVLDEAHHLLPAEWTPPDSVMPESLENVLLITVHPDLLAPHVLERIETVIVVGPGAEATLGAYCRSAGAAMPAFDGDELAEGEVLVWRRGRPPQRVQSHPSRFERRRHRRKYAEGKLPPERSFYFRGPEEKLNLRAYNLTQFLELADGVDDETWKHHLKRRDVSRWLRECIKDDALADAVQRIEEGGLPSAAGSRAAIRAEIERDYVMLPTAPLNVPGAG